MVVVVGREVESMLIDIVGVGVLVASTSIEQGSGKARRRRREISTINEMPIERKTNDGGM
jgi:hypothetical protein